MRVHPYVKIALGVLAAGTIIGTTVVVVKKIRKRRQISGYNPKNNVDYTGGKSKGASYNPTEIADTLAVNLGTAYGALDPRSWTENDQTVYETLLYTPSAIFPGVEKAYNKVYGRNLRMDLKKMLDSNLYAQIKYLS